MRNHKTTVPRVEEKLAFLGAGIIAGVWMERLLSMAAMDAGRIMACDTRTERLEELRRQLGVEVSSNNSEGAGFAP